MYGTFSADCIWPVTRTVEITGHWSAQCTDPGLTTRSGDPPTARRREEGPPERAAQRHNAQHARTCAHLQHLHTASLQRERASRAGGGGGRGQVISVTGWRRCPSRHHSLSKSWRRHNHEPRDRVGRLRATRRHGVAEIGRVHCTLWLHCVRVARAGRNRTNA